MIKKASKKLIVLAIAAIMALGVGLFVGCEDGSQEKIFNTEHELRAFLPQYYYFDFNLAEQQLFSARVLLNGRNNFVAYGIAYTFASDFSEEQKNAELILSCVFGKSLNRELTGNASVKIVDGIETIFDFVWSSESFVRVSLVFEIEGSCYNISISKDINREQIEEFCEYVFSILAPAVENRQKG